MSKQTIYNALRKGGLTEVAALAMMGNWMCESGLEPNRLQGDFSPYRTLSKDYVRRIEDFTLSRDQFSHDSKGFGLAQWTYWSRKEALWVMWHSSGVSIASDELQVKFALYELKTDYSSLYDYLMVANDLYTATSRICKEFERPAVNNVDARFSAAKKLKYEIDLDQTEEQPPEETHELVLPDLSMGSSGDAVILLQAVLNVRGYNSGKADGIFGAKTQSAVNSFKRDNQMDPDGKVDKQTWREVIRYE